MRGDQPVLRLTLEGLGQTITAAFMRHAEEMSEQVSALVKQEIEAFDFDAHVRAAVRPAIAKALANAVESHFAYGEGREAIDAAVRAAVAKA